MMAGSLLRLQPGSLLPGSMHKLLQAKKSPNVFIIMYRRQSFEKIHLRLSMMAKASNNSVMGRSSFVLPTNRIQVSGTFNMTLALKQNKEVSSMLKLRLKFGLRITRHCS